MNERVDVIRLTLGCPCAGRAGRVSGWESKVMLVVILHLTGRTAGGRSVTGTGSGLALPVRLEGGGRSVTGTGSGRSVTRLGERPNRTVTWPTRAAVMDHLAGQLRSDPLGERRAAIS